MIACFFKPYQPVYHQTSELLTDSEKWCLGVVFICISPMKEIEHFFICLRALVFLCQLPFHIICPFFYLMVSLKKLFPGVLYMWEISSLLVIWITNKFLTVFVIWIWICLFCVGIFCCICSEFFVVEVISIFIYSS